MKCANFLMCEYANEKVIYRSAISRLANKHISKLHHDSEKHGATRRGVVFERGGL